MCRTPEIRKCVLKFLGANMVVVSSATVGLGIADLALTILVWCNQLSRCGTGLTNSLALTYVAVAIWAPLPIFFNGIGAIWIADRPQANTGWLCLLSFLNTCAFGPVIVIVTALEITYKFPQSVVPPDQPSMAIYGVEVTIAVVGAVLFLHALAVLYLNCCCTSCMQEAMTQTAVVKVDAPGTEVYIERQDQGYAPRCPTRDHTQDDVDRLNLWSAYRQKNTCCGPPAPPTTRTSYYASGDIATRYAPGAYSGVAGAYFAPGPRSVLAGGGAAVARW